MLQRLVSNDKIAEVECEALRKVASIKRELKEFEKRQKSMPTPSNAGRKKRIKVESDDAVFKDEGGSMEGGGLRAGSNSSNPHSAPVYQDYSDAFWAGYEAAAEKHFAAEGLGSGSGIEGMASDGPPDFELVGLELAGVGSGNGGMIGDGIEGLETEGIFTADNGLTQEELDAFEEFVNAGDVVGESRRRNLREGL